MEIMEIIEIFLFFVNVASSIYMYSIYSRMSILIWDYLWVKQ